MNLAGSITASPLPNHRERLEAGLRRFESLSAAQPEEARRWIRDQMPALIRALEENPSTRPTELVRELRLLRQVRRQALALASNPTLEQELRGVEASMRLLRDRLRGTLGVAEGGRPSAEQIRHARCCAELSRELGENFYLHDDLVTWTRLLQSSGGLALSQEEGSAQALALLQAWGALREATVSRAENSNAAALPMNPEQISGRMGEAADLLTARLGLGDTARTAVRAYLSRLIASNRPRVLSELSLESLATYAATANELQVQIDRAQAETDPVRRRPLLLRALSQAATSGNEADAVRIRSLLDATLPSPGSSGRESAQLEMLIAAHDLVQGHSLEIESRLRREIEGLCRSIGSRERALLSPEELRGRSLPPNHAPSGTAAELTERARSLTLAHGFYLSIHSEQAGFLFLSLRRVRTELRTALRSGPAMDPVNYTEACRALAELSMASVGGRTVEIRLRRDEIYENRIAQARARGQDVSWSFQQREIREQAQQAALREYSEGLRRDVDRFLVATGRLAQARPPVAMERRLEYCRSASLLVRNLRGLREGGEPLLAASLLTERGQVIDRLWTRFFEDSLEQSPSASLVQRSLAQDIVYDLRTRVHFAMAENARPEELAWLWNLNGGEVLEFARRSQAAHVLTLDRRQDPPSAADLTASLQAAQIYASLGLDNRVREVTQPLESYAAGLNASEPVTAGQRADLLLVLAQIYAQTGDMELQLTNTLQAIVALDRPGPLHGSAQLGRAMIAMQEGNLDRARELLLALPEHPMAQAFLQNLREGQRAQRIAQTVGVLRAVSLNFIARGREAGHDVAAMERDTIGGWEEIQRLMISGECPDLESASRRMAESGRFPHFASSTEYHVPGNVGVFIGTVENPNLSDAEFHDAIFSLACSLRTDGYFLAANSIYDGMRGDPRLRSRAEEAQALIPTQARVQAILSPFAIFTSGADPIESLGNLAMLVVPFGVARGVGAGAEGAFVARATGGSLRLTEAGWAVQAGSRTVQGLGMMRFGVRASSEAAAFTVTSMGMHSLLAWRTDNWTWANFGREFGSMLLTFGLCHGIQLGMQSVGRTAARFETLRAPGALAEQGALGLRPTVQGALSLSGYGATIAGLTGLEYFQEAVGLRPSHGDIPIGVRLLGSAMMDAQMRMARRGVDAVSGGRITAFENSTHRAQADHDLLPGLDRLGLPRPDAEGRMEASTAMVMNLWRQRVADGADPSAIVASLSPAPRRVSAVGLGSAWGEWLRAQALGSAFLFTGTMGGTIGRIPRRASEPPPEEPWWNEESERRSLEDFFAEQDFADVYWPSEAAAPLRLGLPGSRVPESQLAALATVLARAPQGAQPRVRIELAALSEPAGLSVLLPLVERGFAFELRVGERALNLSPGERDSLVVEGIDAAALRALAPSLRNFRNLTLRVGGSEEAFELTRLATEAGLEGVRAVTEDLPGATIQHGPHGSQINLELRGTEPAEALAALQRMANLPESRQLGTQIYIQGLEPSVFRQAEVQQALAALTRTALAGGTRGLSLRLNGSSREAGALALRLTPNHPVTRTRYRLESDLPVEQISEALSEYLAAESLALARLGSPASAPSLEQLSQFWRAAMDHVGAYSRHRQAGEEYRPYWSESGSLRGWRNGIENLAAFARARGNSAGVQRGLANLLQYSEPAGSTVLDSAGFSGRALGDNAFELMRLAEQASSDLPSVFILLGGGTHNGVWRNSLMGRNGNVEVGGALVGTIFKRLVLNETGARHETNVLQEQIQAAAANGGGFRFIILPENSRCNTPTPDWAVEPLDPTGRARSMITVEVKSRDVGAPRFTMDSLRQTLHTAIEQLTTHPFQNGTVNPSTELTLRLTNVGPNSNLGVEVTRMVNARYRELLRLGPTHRAAAEAMRRMGVEIHLQGSGGRSERIRLGFEAGEWRESSGTLFEDAS